MLIQKMFRNVFYRFQNHQKQYVRFLSKATKKRVRNQHDLKFLPEKDMAALMAYFPKFIEDVKHKDILLGVTKIENRMEKLIKHVLPSGKLLRLHTLVFVYKMIETHFGKAEPDEEKMKKLHQMCWCLEAHSNTYIILDDMIDSNDTRRGKVTWTDIVGIGAANDALLLEYVLLLLLRKYFSDHPNYQKLYDTFIEPHCPISMAFELENTEFEDFTMDNLKLTAALKMQRHNYDHPIEIATLLADKGHYINELVKKACVPIGFLFSIQNDIADCYGNDLTGKKCVDIQDKRGAYPIVVALQKASPTQRKVLEECYGSHDEKKINRVKEMYDELDILNEYFKTEEEYVHKIHEEVEKIPDEFTRSLMRKLAYVHTFGQVGEPPYEVEG